MTSNPFYSCLFNIICKVEIAFNYPLVYINVSYNNIKNKNKNKISLTRMR